MQDAVAELDSQDSPRIAAVHVGDHAGEAQLLASSLGDLLSHLLPVAAGVVGRASGEQAVESPSPDVGLTAASIAAMPPFPGALASSAAADSLAARSLQHVLGDGEQGRRSPGHLLATKATLEWQANPPSAPCAQPAGSPEAALLPSTSSTDGQATADRLGSDGGERATPPPWQTTQHSRLGSPCSHAGSPTPPVALELSDPRHGGGEWIPGGEPSDVAHPAAALPADLQSPSCSHVDLLFDGDAASPVGRRTVSSRSVALAASPAALLCQPALLPPAPVAAPLEPVTSQQQVPELMGQGQYAQFLHQLLQLDMRKPK